MSVLLRPRKWALEMPEETDVKQMVDTNRQLGRVEFLDVAKGLTDNTAEQKAWAPVLQLQDSTVA